MTSWTDSVANSATPCFATSWPTVSAICLKLLVASSFKSISLSGTFNIFHRFLNIKVSAMVSNPAAKTPAPMANLGLISPFVSSCSLAIPPVSSAAFEKKPPTDLVINGDPAAIRPKPGTLLAPANNPPPAK